MHPDAAAPVTELAPTRVPDHIAIIMDGNGRWAKAQGLERLHGHRAGAESVRRTVEACRKLGVRYLTLFAFSTENWKRNKSEVDGLMMLFAHHLRCELDELLKNGVRLLAVGDLQKLPQETRELLEQNVAATANQSALTLILAVSYGGREEIVHAAKELALKVQRGELNAEDITTEHLASALWTAGVPDPDLLIRTSGEERISNFLLWQLAYSEIVVVPENWPEFTEEILERCIRDYNRRERRFGLTSEQLTEV